MSRKVVAMALMMAFLRSSVPAQAKPDEMPWVAVSKDKKGFVLESSGRPFVPWDFNYDHDYKGRLLEDYWGDEWTSVEAHFGQMKKLGAIVVRVHLQLGKFMDGPEKPNDRALDGLGKLLELAERLRLYLDLTSLGCYHKKDVPAWYDKLSEKERWDVQARFWQAVAGRCAESPAVFCYDLMNEPVVPGGKRKDEDWLGPPFGRKHFVQFITLDQADRPRPDIARQWVRHLATAIREKDKRHLITVDLVHWSLDRKGLTSGLVPAEGGGRPRFRQRPPVPEDSSGGGGARDAGGLYGRQAGADRGDVPLACSLKELEEFIDGSNKPAAGWIGFYWGKSPEELRRSNTISDALTLGWLELFEKRVKDVAR